MTIIRSYLPLKRISLECRTSILNKEILISQIDSIPFTFYFLKLKYSYTIVPFLFLLPILPMHITCFLSLKSQPSFFVAIYIYIISYIIYPKFLNITFLIHIILHVCVHYFSDEHLVLNNQLEGLFPMEDSFSYFPFLVLVCMLMSLFKSCLGSIGVDILQMHQLGISIA